MTRATHTGGGLDFDASRAPVAPKDAATLVLVRGGAEGGVEVFCVERNKKSRFMGGAIVFPGGKLDASDADAAWSELATAPRALEGRAAIAGSDAELRALAIAACRETLEEAAILPVQGGAVTDDELSALRARLVESPGALREFLGERGMRLDLGALHPFARWITPEAESRRFDARFFVAVAPEGQKGAHDEKETMASFWASPAEVLRRFDAGEVQLMPPTHRTIALLGACATVDDVLAMAARACLDPVCPRLVPHADAHGETLALVLPGDPEHAVAEARVPGPSRFVLRGERWLPEGAPR